MTGKMESENELVVLLGMRLAQGADGATDSGSTAGKVGADGAATAHSTTSDFVPSSPSGTASAITADAFSTVSALTTLA